MILADTSVWIHHIRRRIARFQQLLVQRRVVIHPFVIGELACGNLPDRSRFIAALHLLPQSRMVEHSGVLSLIDSEHLFGKGLGWFDAHLLASALAENHGLWTLDHGLVEAAHHLGCMAVVD